MPSKKGNESKNNEEKEPEVVMSKEERDFRTKIFELASKNEGKAMVETILQYSNEKSISPTQVLAQSKDSAKRTVLHFACQSPPSTNNDNGGMDIVQFLLTHDKFPSAEMGAILVGKDKEGQTPLMVACQKMHEKTFERIKCIVDLLGSKATVARSKVEATALHYAAGAGASKEIICYLYENGKAALNACTSQGATPLHWASGVPPSQDFSETLNALLDDCGADVNPAKKEDVSALIFAVAGANDKHAQILVKHGADRGLLLGGGVTCFHIAADLGLTGTLRALIDADAKEEDQENTVSAKCLKMTSAKGETPLDQAAQGGHLECVKILSGEQDDAKAKALMEKLRKNWTEKKVEKLANDMDKNKIADGNSASSGEANKTAQNDSLPFEDEAKRAASVLNNSPPDVSDEDKVKATEAKAKGNSHFGNKEFQEAIDAYSEAIALNPVDATYYSNRSACYMSMEQYEKALYDAIMCRMLNPTWVKACYRMTVARMALHRYEDAAVSAWEGLEIDETNSDLRYLLKKSIAKGKKEHEEKTGKKK